MRQVVVVAALVAAFLVAVPALAAEPVSVDVEVGTHHGAIGELVLVATVDTGPGLACTGAVVPENPESEHDNTDVVFVSGEAGGTIFDVEVPTFDPDQTISFVSEGPTKIFFRIGDDGVISAGFVAMLDCHEPGETTTTTVAVETTTTTVPTPDTTTTTHVDTPTTITAPPPGCPQDPTTPCGPVDAGGGAMAVDGGAMAIILGGLPDNATMLWGGAGLLAFAALIGAVGLATRKKSD